MTYSKPVQNHAPGCPLSTADPSASDAPLWGTIIERTSPQIEVFDYINSEFLEEIREEVAAPRCVSDRPLSALRGIDFMRALGVLHDAFLSGGVEDTTWYVHGRELAVPTFALTGLTSLYLVYGIGSYAPCVPELAGEGLGQSLDRGAELGYGLPVMRPDYAIRDLHRRLPAPELAGLIQQALAGGLTTREELAETLDTVTVDESSTEALRRYLYLAGEATDV